MNIKSNAVKILVVLVVGVVGYFIGANSQPDIKIRTEVEIQEEINKKVAVALEDYKKSLNIVRKFDKDTGKLVEERIKQKEESKKQSFTSEESAKKDIKITQEIEIRKKNYLGFMIGQEVSLRDDKTQQPEFKIEPKQDLDIIYKHDNYIFKIGTDTTFDGFHFGIGTGFSF